MIDKQTNDCKGFKLGSRRYKTIDGFMHAIKNESKDDIVSVDPDDFQDGIEIECAPDCESLDCACPNANKDEIVRVDVDDFVEAIREVERRRAASDAR